MGDAYDFSDVDSGDLSRVVSKLRSNLKNRDVVVKNLKIAAGILEKLPQDVASLGSARGGLGDLLSDKHVLGSKHKDVKMYAAVCLVHLLRIYAPETPYEDDKDMQIVFDLLQWSVQLVQEYQSPMFELAVSVLQTISETKSYYLILDMGKDDIVVEWVRTLLQCVNAGSQAHAGPHVMEVLNGFVSDEGGVSDAVLEVLLSHLVPPKSQESQPACQMAQAVLRACEPVIKPRLQKFVTTLILSPISSNSDLHQHCNTLIYQLYQCVPQVLLPVMPHITSELQAEAPAKRLEAVQLLCQLFSVPGNKLVCQYDDVLDALLGRYRDTQVDVRTYMVEFTPTLVAAVGSEEKQHKVLKEAAVRLQDYEEKIRLAAVKAICQVARQLLVGPASAAKGGTAGAACNTTELHMVVAPPPVADLLGASQEDDEAAAADLGVTYTPPDQAVAAGVGAADEAARDLPYVQEVLKMVCMRLRDTKPSVRKQTASSLIAIFRAVAAAGTPDLLSKYCWLPARVLLCCKTDVELRSHIVEGTMKDGLLGSQVPPGQCAAMWVRLWLSCSQLERDVIMVLLGLRARLQADALTFLALRRKLSGKDKDPDAAEPLKRDLDKAARHLSAGMPQASKAMEGLAALQSVRDNHVFAALQQALAPAATPQAYLKSRADALSRVGSRSASAEFISQLLLWARPAAWLPQPLLSALLDMAAGDPDGDQGPAVKAAYQLLQRVSKAAPMLFAGMLPQLQRLLQSSEPDLQQLAAQLIAQCARDQRKRGIVLSASADAATAALVKQQLLPCLRQLARGNSIGSYGSKRHHGTPDSDENGEQFFDAMEDHNRQEQSGANAAAVAPKAAKWAVYGLAACQDSSSSRKELEGLAHELVEGLDSGAPDTAAKLQALSAIGRVLPDAFGRHAEQLLSFVLDDYLLTYLDAAATAPAGAAAGATSSRSPGGPISPNPLLSPGNTINTASTATDSRDHGGGSPSMVMNGTQAEAAAVWLKAAALKALAAGCVPDSDSADVPVETQRVASCLAQDLEGLLDPTEEARPQFLADAPEDVAGQLRLAAAAALLRLARRHDSRIGSNCYCMLGLVMQDSLEGVRAAFSNKVYKLVKYFNVRPSTHQLAAKYAAMLPLAAVDPVVGNKEAAARQYKEWVHQRRTAAQQHVTSAATAAGGSAGAAGGGSTLQDMPEMVVPYGLYMLAHHPDFPVDEAADDVEAYQPFQYMLQFMLQPLLVASGVAAAGATAAAVIKMCSFLKFTADIAEEPATVQLYVLSDMAVATIAALAKQMGIDDATVREKYSGSIILPKNLYTPLDKEERAANSSTSYLPPGFKVEFDPEPVAALAHAPGHTGAATAAAATAALEKKQHARGTRPRTAAAAAANGAAAGRGSKRKVGTAGGSTMADEAVNGGAGQAEQGPAKRSRGRPRTKRTAAESSDDEWGSDEEPEAPSAVKTEQLTSRQRKLQQQKEQQQQQRRRSAAGTGSAAAADSDDLSGDDEAHSPPPEQQQHKQQGRQSAGQQRAAGRKQQQYAHKMPTKQQQRGRQQQQKLDMKQQPLTFTSPVADASSPAPVRPKTRPAAAAAPSQSDSEGDDMPAAGVAAAAEPSVSPGSRRGQQQQQRSAGRTAAQVVGNGHAAATGMVDAVGVQQQQHTQRHARQATVSGQNMTNGIAVAGEDDNTAAAAAAVPGKKRGRRPAAAADLAETSPAPEDQTLQKDNGKPQQAAAAKPRSAAGKGVKAAPAAAAGSKRRGAAVAVGDADGSRSGGGRVTKRRAA